MSTKFYWLPRQVDNYKKLEKSDPKIYIGKRLLSGLFCWDCGIPAYDPIKNKMLDCCPECGNKFEDKKDAIRIVEQSGVGSSSRFVWSMLKHKVRLETMFGLPDIVIEDEHGNRMSTEDFIVDEMLSVVEEKVVYHRGNCEEEGL